jgi:autoinducer 2-degrading protein
MTVAILVDFQVKAEHRDAFLELIRWNAKVTRDTEPGCVGFDIVIADDDPNHVALVELYRDEAARAYHAALPRLVEIRAKYANMIERRTALVGTVESR